MKKYYYRTGHRSNGPFTYRELIELPLERDTSVREEGCDHWKDACELEELRYLFTPGYTAPLPELPRGRRISPVLLWVLTGIVSVLLFFSLFSFTPAR